MQKKPLIELIRDLEQEMLRLGYSKGSMKFYRREWQKLLRFAKERGETYYSEPLGIDFAQKCFSIFEKDLNRTLSRSEMQKMRIIRMLGDFQLHRTVLRRYYKHTEILTDPYFIKISNRFSQYCIDEDYSKVTVEHYVKQSERFMDYLCSQKVTSLKQISITSINAYIKTLAPYSYKTVEQNICSLRTFFRFLLEAGEIKTDFSQKIPMVQAKKQTRIPSVWTRDELKRLIAAIDRGSPKGKRDYAIILLACCLGMRSTDIKNLKLEHFRWEEKKLAFIQSKTGKPLTLPLTPQVGWAVIDYLKYGRPNIDAPYIFVKHMAPFGPFSEGDHLNQLIKRYMELAHLPTLKKRRGMHSLRHTLAGLLLENDTPLSVITDILGHVDPDSTAVYLKIDINKLKECCLDFEEAHHE